MADGTIRPVGDSTERKTLWGGLGPAMAGPAAILLTIPLLVLGVGAFITWTTWSQQRAAVRTLAERSIERGAEQIQEELVAVLADGNAVLDALHDHLDRRGGVLDPESFAWTFRDQFLGRPMVVYVALGTESGNYYGVFRNTEDGSPRLTRRERVQPSDADGHLRDFSFSGDRLVQVREDPAYPYDPRVRPWYRRALEAGDRITSEPYVLFDSGVVGVTVAEPYRGPDGRLVGVLEVDFNINSMSAIAERLGQRHEATILLHTEREEILALPGLRQRELKNQEGQGRLPNAADLEGPELAAYFTAARIGQRSGADLEREEFDVGDEAWLAAVRPIHMPGGVTWRAASLASLDQRLVAVDADAAQGLAVVLVALVVATVLALFFARHIVRTHVRAARAERAAAKAQDAVRSIGAYHLYKVLGEGGMGEVWLAEHGLLARPVAVKLVNAKYFGEMTAQEREVTISRFEREARTLAQLRSPATITIYDFGVSDDGDLFYVMELLDGMDLYQLVDRHGAQPVGRVIPILIAAARSLAEAHSRGLVHRDIKPANIYLCRLAGELDVVKVLDFGMVRKVDGGSQRLTMQGTIEGTPPYMAPEQIQDSDEVDGRCDLYALALVGYYLLSGKEVFLRDSPMDTLMAHLNDQAPALGEVAEQAIPDGLDHVLTACLAKSASDRPPSMEVFIDALLAIPLPPELRFGELERRNWWASIPEPDHIVGGVPTANVRDLHKRAAETRT